MFIVGIGVSLKIAVDISGKRNLLDSSSSSSSLVAEILSGSDLPQNIFASSMMKVSSLQNRWRKYNRSISQLAIEPELRWRSEFRCSFAVPWHLQKHVWQSQVSRPCYGCNSSPSKRIRQKEVCRMDQPGTGCLSLSPQLCWICCGDEGAERPPLVPSSSWHRLTVSTGDCMQISIRTWPNIQLGCNLVRRSFNLENLIFTSRRHVVGRKVIGLIAKRSLLI